MKFLMDVSSAKLDGKWPESIVRGQLLTPLTRYANWGGEFAIDNGAYSGLDREGFARLIERNAGQRHLCLFVAVPDVVGSARRTLELWAHRDRFVPTGWRLALVAQDGIEDLDIPWDEMHALFLGGRDPWKDSRAAQDVVLTAKALAKHVHIGRVNTVPRFKLYDDLGADTCDGSGVAKFDHMMDAIISHQRGDDLFTMKEA